MVPALRHAHTEQRRACPCVKDEPHKAALGLPCGACDGVHCHGRHLENDDAVLCDCRVVHERIALQHMRCPRNQLELLQECSKSRLLEKTTARPPFLLFAVWCSFTSTTRHTKRLCIQFALLTPPAALLFLGLAQPHSACEWRFNPPHASTCLGPVVCSTSHTSSNSYSVSRVTGPRAVSAMR